MAQAPPIEWQRIFGSPGYDGVWSVRILADGGIIAAGHAGGEGGNVTGFNGGDLDLWVLKLNAAGGLEWQKLYGSGGSDWAVDIRAVPTGGYVVVGSASANSGDVSGNHGQGDVWVLRLDDQGDLLWQKCLGGSGPDHGRGVTVGHDGSLVILASTASSDGDVGGTQGNSDYWVVKLDDQGEIVWQYAYGGSGIDDPQGIETCADDGYIITGRSGSQDGDITAPLGLTSIWIIKVDQNGILQWERSFGGSTGDDDGYGIHATADGGAIAIGTTNSGDGIFQCNQGGGDLHLVKLSATGDVEWQQACVGGTGHERARGVVQTSNGHFLVAGMTGSADGDVTANHGSFDGWLLEFDPVGNLLWEHCFGGSGGESFNAIALAPDGGFVVGGFNGSGDWYVPATHGGEDVWIVKFGDGGIGIRERPGRLPLLVHPNPARDQVHLSLSGTSFSGTVALHDAVGRTVLEEPWPAGASSLSLNTTHLLPGTYSVSMAGSVPYSGAASSSPRHWSGKLVILP